MRSSAVEGDLVLAFSSVMVLLVGSAVVGGGYICVIDQAQDGWILAKFFFCVFMDRDEVEVHKNAKKKKRTRPISSHLDRTSLVNKGFIIWLYLQVKTTTTKQNR